MLKNVFNLIICSVLIIGLVSCKELEKQLAIEKKAESQSNCKEHPKLIKTQGSQGSDNVHCSLQDSQGNIWLGTTGEGLYKFNGTSFVQYTISDGLSSNTIYCIFEDKEGNLWIGTDDGLLIYNGVSFKEMHVTTPVNSIHNKLQVFSIIQDSTNKIWLATVEGVYIFYEAAFEHFEVNKEGKGFMSKENNVERIFEDAKGNIWFGGRGNEGVYCFDGTSIKNYKMPNLNGHNWAWPVLQDERGDVWFSNWGGSYRFDGKSFSNFTSENGLSSDIVIRIFKDSKGNLWFSCGGDSGGLCCYNGKNVTCYKITDKIKDKGAWSILEDKEGNLWVGTRNTGLFKYDGQTFKSFSEI